MLQGNPLIPSVSIEKSYLSELRVLVLAMHKAMMKELQASLLQEPEKGVSVPSKPPQPDTAMDAGFVQLPAAFTVKQKDLRQKYESILERLGTVAATRFIEKQLKYAARSFVHSMKPLIEGGSTASTLNKAILGGRGASMTLQGAFMESSNAAMIEPLIAQNVSLIKTIGTKYFDRVEAAIAKSLQKGGSRPQLIKDLVPLMKETGDKALRQAKFIARDQTSKIYSQVCIEEMKACGITKVKWIHSSAGKVPRPYHKTRWDGVSYPPNGLNGYIHDINNPPVIDLKTGERGVAGSIFNCRCLQVPVLDI